MTTFTPIYIVDIIKEVVESMTTELRPVYIYGKNPQIADELNKLTSSKSKKFPLLAVYMPFDERFGITSYYCEVTFPKISICNLTTSTDSPEDRYINVYKPVLYPVFNDFLEKLSWHRQVLTKDKNEFSYTKRDVQSLVPSSAVNDFIDAIEIYNLKTNISQIISC